MRISRKHPKTLTQPPLKGTRQAAVQKHDTKRGLLGRGKKEVDGQYEGRTHDLGIYYVSRIAY